MKRIVAFVCVAFALPAVAQRAYESPTGLFAAPWTGGGSDSGLIEDFESFTAQGFPVSGGWTSNYDPNFAITADSPVGGLLSWRHTADGSGFADTGRSPTFAQGFGILAADVQITGNSLYQFNSLPTATTTYNTRINFTPDGQIQALQVVGGAGAFSATTGTFVPGEIFQIGIETTAAGGLNIYKNGVNIFSGTEINFALSGVAQGIGQALQFGGNTADAIGSMTLDNFTNTLIPAPGSAALLGLAGVIGLRRRRA